MTFNPFGKEAGNLDSKVKSQEEEPEEPVVPEPMLPKKSENVSPKLTPEKKDSQEVDVEEIKKQLETIGDEVDKLKEQRDQEVGKRKKAEEKVDQLEKEAKEKDKEFAQQIGGVQEQIQEIIAKHQSGDADSKKETPADELPVENPFSS